MGKIGVGKLKPNKVGKKNTSDTNIGRTFAGKDDKFGLRKGSGLDKNFKK